MAAEPNSAVLTPGVKEQLLGVLAETPLDANETSAFRSETARCNYLPGPRPPRRGLRGKRAVPPDVSAGPG